MGEGCTGDSQTASTPSQVRWSSRRRMPGRAPTPSPPRPTHERGVNLVDPPALPPDRLGHGRLRLAATGYSDRGAPGSLVGRSLSPVCEERDADPRWPQAAGPAAAAGAGSVARVRAARA